MGGQFLRLPRGRYNLVVGPGKGPAGIRRENGVGVDLSVDGGWVDFALEREERVFFWWRGDARPVEVALRTAQRTGASPPADTRADPTVGEAHPGTGAETWGSLPGPQDRRTLSLNGEHVEFWVVSGPVVARPALIGRTAGEGAVLEDPARHRRLGDYSDRELERLYWQRFFRRKPLAGEPDPV